MISPENICLEGNDMDAPPRLRLRPPADAVQRRKFDLIFATQYSWAAEEDRVFAMVVSSLRRSAPRTAAPPNDTEAMLRTHCTEVTRWCERHTAAPGTTPRYGLHHLRLITRLEPVYLVKFLHLMTALGFDRAAVANDDSEPVWINAWRYTPGRWTMDNVALFLAKFAAPYCAATLTSDMGETGLARALVARRTTPLFLTIVKDPASSTAHDILAATIEAHGMALRVAEEEGRVDGCHTVRAVANSEHEHLPSGSMMDDANRGFFDNMYGLFMRRAGREDSFREILTPGQALVTSDTALDEFDPDSPALRRTLDEMGLAEFPIYCMRDGRAMSTVLLYHGPDAVLTTVYLYRETGRDVMIMLTESKSLAEYRQTEKDFSADAAAIEACSRCPCRERAR